MAEQLHAYETCLLFISRLGTCCSQCKRPPGPCRWLLDLSAKYAANAEDRPLTVDENETDETIPEIPVINSFTPLDQATDIQTDDSPTTQNRMPSVMVNIEDQNAKDITNLIGSEFGNRLFLKLAPKHLKCTALDNQSYQDLITYLQNNEFKLMNFFYKTTPKSMWSLKVGVKRVTS
ncbi:hypothetical protein CEXT_42771 [Caerostris extrusa]|uniref:Uncharacterized protein n=1 Tax=Caerostris extrusa TaxID=172846 RepID=A0AAV4TVT9_CAEEX|nr:hypothetical protein CEXT_42771 [Caerostris extrusa]